MLSNYEKKLIDVLGLDKEAYERSKRIRESFQPIIYERRMNYDWNEPGKKARKPKLLNVSNVSSK